MTIENQAIKNTVLIEFDETIFLNNQALMVYFSSLCKRNMRNIKHFQVLTCSFLCKQCFTLEAISSS